MDSSGKSLLPLDDDSSADLVEGPPSSGRLRAFAQPAQIEEARARSGRYTSISPAATRAFLGKAETQSLILSVVRARLAQRTPSDVVDDIVQTANERMLSTQSGPRALTTARGWACAVTRSEVVRHFRRKKAEARWLLDDASIEDHPDPGPEPSGDRTFESVAEELGMKPARCASGSSPSRPSTSPATAAGRRCSCSSSSSVGRRSRSRSGTCFVRSPP